MKLVKGKVYEAVNKIHLDKVLTFRVDKVHSEYFSCTVLDSSYYTSSTMFATDNWFFYELSEKGSYERNVKDILAAQALAVELDCKNLFDSYSRDLKFMGLGEKGLKRG
jgi:hypothetical protein